MRECIDCKVGLDAGTPIWKTRCAQCYGRNKDKTSGQTYTTSDAKGRPENASVSSEEERMRECLNQARTLVADVWPDIDDNMRATFEKEIGTSLFIQQSQKALRRM